MNSSGGDAFGGAVYGTFNSHEIHFVNDTIAFNTALGGANTGTPIPGPIVKGPGFTGPIFHQPAGAPGNAYGGGLANSAGTWKLLNTIVAQNNVGTVTVAFNGVKHTPIFHASFSSGSSDVASTAGEVGSSYTDLGHNLIGNIDGSSGFTFGLFYGSAKLLYVANPGFAAAGLAFNGGPTQTIAIVTTSLAHDTADDSVVNGGGQYAPLGLSLLTTDQRGPGFARKVGPHVDIGAYEIPAPPASRGRDIYPPAYQFLIALLFHGG